MIALTLAFADWSGNNCLMLHVEGHGREGLFDAVDINRTVGWFTSLYPVVLSLTQDALNNPGEAIKNIKEQLHIVPNKGIGYGLLRYLNQDDELKQSLATKDTAQITFNYLGQFDAALKSDLFELSAESIGL